MNVPNALTVFRIVLIPVYLLIFFSSLPNHIQIAFFILILAGLTDIVDGYIARTYKMVTEFGTMMDPLADKLMMLTVITSFYLTERISVWAALFFFARDVGMIVASAIFHFRGKKTVPANVYGKITTVLFYLVFTLVMFRFPYAEYFLWLVIAFSFITSAIYILKFRLLNKMY
ncbi:CDP-alcohol phosphatidyltransferase family protein [Brevibacillus massiliensis]|uniref:CDP-alcohol phosphatidyltransferase family protein n=1 Tax=Brevibacillus massiliensis TaxID=1118054 RepID=UPI0002D7147C|nr:CDP-alcohol phosphatidyltransferase family protein [Brevibacillus massiliensis]